MESLLNRYDTNKEAVFVVLPDGCIEICNNIAAELFGFDHPEEMTGFQAADLVPDDFRQFFPTVITEEHLTGGEYLPRVNKRKQGTLFPTEVLTYFKEWGDQQYVMVHIRPVQSDKMETLLLQQNIAVLHNELKKERNQKNEMNQSDMLQQLGTTFPQLTGRDLEFCCLLIKNYSSKQIADVLNITLDGVFAARKRLRKKLNVPSGGDLATFLLAIAPQCAR